MATLPVGMVRSRKHKLIQIWARMGSYHRYDFHLPSILSTPKPYHLPGVNGNGYLDRRYDTAAQLTMTSFTSKFANLVLFGKNQESKSDRKSNKFQWESFQSFDLDAGNRKKLCEIVYASEPSQNWISSDLSSLSMANTRKLVPSRKAAREKSGR